MFDKGLKDMVISASRRTDIPAFYSSWFMNRITEGCFVRVNPFNPTQRSKISLHPADVDAFVFWTKNPKPLLPHLDRLDSCGYQYYFLYTLNDYPSYLEPFVPPSNERIGVFKELAGRIGKDKVIWRYDPIIFTTGTPLSYHLETIEQIATQLGDSTEKMIFSFFDSYNKLNKRLQSIENANSVEILEYHNRAMNNQAHEIADRINSICKSYSISPQTCAEDIDLEKYDIHRGACIDPGLIRSVSGREISSRKDNSQRPHCLCMQSVDMGVYSTCRFNCAYCYANGTEKTMDTCLSNHDVEAECLVSFPSSMQRP